MVSICCEDCKAEKIKIKLFNKLLLNDNCNLVSEYLGCDYCSLTPEQQQMFKFVKSKPFPKTTKELQDIMNGGECANDRYNLQYFSGKRYLILKDLYEHFYSSHYMETQGLMKKQQLDTELKKLKYFQKYDANENYFTNQFIIHTILGVFGYHWCRESPDFLHYNWGYVPELQSLLQLNNTNEPTFLLNLKKQIKWYSEN